MSSNPAIATPAVPVPWWKFGHVWLVIAGPAIVIVAGFVTLWLAISRPDPVVAEDYYRQGIEINKTLVAPEKSLAPAPRITTARALRSTRPWWRRRKAWHRHSRPATMRPPPCKTNHADNPPVAAPSDPRQHQETEPICGRNA